MQKDFEAMLDRQKEQLEATTSPSRPVPKEWQAEATTITQSASEARWRAFLKPPPERRD
jgi:hypothetical protein